MFAKLGSVDRRHELENLRRSIAMLTPGVQALTREQALELLSEIEDLDSRLRRLRTGLTAMLAEDERRARTGEGDRFRGTDEL